MCYTVNMGIDKNQGTRGFTIVELLVVIVVIAIIATISIASYDGITQRAHNTKTLGAVAQYSKIIELYQAQNGGKYPQLSSGTITCLGKGYKNGTCTTVTNYTSDAGFHTALETVSKNLPMPSTEPIRASWNSDVATGIQYRDTLTWINDRPILDGANHDKWLVYYLVGADATCANGHVGVASAWPQVTRKNPGKHTVQLANGVECWHPI